MRLSENDLAYIETVNDTTTFYCNGWEVIEERDGSDSLLARYFHGRKLEERLMIKRKRWILCSGAGIVIVVSAVLFLAVTREIKYAESVHCRSNMCQITLGTLMYIQDHDGFVPQSLGDVVEYVGGATSLFLCGSSDEDYSEKLRLISEVPALLDGLSSYRLVGGYNSRDIPWQGWSPMILIYEKQPMHADAYGLLRDRDPRTHHTVGFFDGHRELLTSEELARTLASTKELIAKAREAASDPEHTGAGPNQSE